MRCVRPHNLPKCRWVARLGLRLVNARVKCRQMILVRQWHILVAECAARRVSGSLD
jgi:hypothetical protein